MGEYARRVSDGSEVKIGTCEEMLYLRFSDRSKVSVVPGNVNVNDDSMAGQLLFRLPFPDENGVEPGDYLKAFRQVRLWREREDRRGYDDFTEPELIEQPGIMQLTHESGLLLNLPCYHGMQLPNVVKPMQAFWNGKSWSLELAMLRCTQDPDGTLVLHPVIACRSCRRMWRTQWEKIWDYVQDDALRVNIQLEAGKSARLSDEQFLKASGIDAGRGSIPDNDLVAAAKTEAMIGTEIKFVPEYQR
jgi:hypothetical protein